MLHFLSRMSSLYTVPRCHPCLPSSIAPTQPTSAISSSFLIADLIFLIADDGWYGVQSVFTHVENYLASGQAPPPEILHHYNRWVCPQCLLLVHFAPLSPLQSLQDGTRKRLYSAVPASVAPSRGASTLDDADLTAAHFVLPIPSADEIRDLHSIF